MVSASHNLWFKVTLLGELHCKYFVFKFGKQTGAKPTLPLAKRLVTLAVNSV